MTGRLPDFLIVGAQKCGTSTLFDWLCAHPAVSRPHFKELQFFNDERQWSKGPAAYRKWFARTPRRLLVGEATPEYMLYLESVERMAQTVPDARLIAILREPIARAYSQYRMNLHLRWESRSFDRAVLEELEAGDVEPSLERMRSTGSPEYNYLARGHYLPQLDRLCRYYPRDRLLVLLLDDLVEDPAGSFASVCRFLQISPSEQPPAVGEARNTSAELSRFNPSALRFRLLYRFRLWRVLPRPISEWMERSGGSELVPAEPPTAETVEALRDHFEPRNDALARWLGRDLSQWRAAPRFGALTRDAGYARGGAEADRDRGLDVR